MRSFNGYDEFFWDGPGFGNPLIKDVKITTTVPGGAQGVNCFTGPPRSTTRCETADYTEGGKAPSDRPMCNLEQASALVSRSSPVW